MIFHINGNFFSFYATLHTERSLHWPKDGQHGIVACCCRTDWLQRLKKKIVWQSGKQKCINRRKDHEEEYFFTGTKTWGRITQNYDSNNKSDQERYCKQREKSLLITETGADCSDVSSQYDYWLITVAGTALYSSKNNFNFQVGVVCIQISL